MIGTPPARRRMLGAALRRSRESPGYTLEDAARVLACDRSKISRIETDLRGIRPGELREEVGEAGLEVTDLVSVEGPAFILGDLDARLADPADRPAVLEVARAIERVPELIGFGPHLIVTGIRPWRF